MLLFTLFHSRGLAYHKIRKEKQVNKEKIVAFIAKRKLDIIVICSLLILSLSVLLISAITRKPGATVRVEIDGDLVAEYPLSVNGTYTLNGGTNVLVIEDGRAYLNYSNCPDHTCERTGKIHYIGEKIVCLPNLVTVSITGEPNSPDDSVDFTS